MVVSLIGVFILLLGAGWVIRRQVVTPHRDGLREVMAVIGEALLLLAGGDQPGRRR